MNVLLWILQAGLAFLLLTGVVAYGRTALSPLI